MTKNVTESRQIAAHGVPNYTQDVIQAVKDGFELDLSKGRHPDLLYNGLLTANFVKYEEDVKILPGGGLVGVFGNAESNKETLEFVTDVIESKPKGRPSKAALLKQELIDTLGEDAAKQPPVKGNK